MNAEVTANTPRQRIAPSTHPQLTRYLLVIFILDSRAIRGAKCRVGGLSTTWWCIFEEEAFDSYR
jgi:hypothetical protein